MADIKTIEGVDVRGKRVLVRVDFNVPVKDGVVGDDTRIRAALPTISYLVEHGAKVILMSHLGRPAGEGYEEKFTLAPAAARLAELIDAPVVFASDTIGEDARAKAANLSDGSIVVLENLRFDKREKKNDPAFCEELASLADLYVNDAFGTAHRAHASTAGVAALLPSYAGFLLAGEVDTLSGMLDAPERPFVAILGGSKASDKVGVIDALIDGRHHHHRRGHVLHLPARRGQTGRYLPERGGLGRARGRDDPEGEAAAGVKLLLPVDIVAADAFAEDAAKVTCGADSIPEDMMGLDIWPKTEELYDSAIAQGATVFWNGPMGVFEMKAFEHGTKAVAEAVAANTQAATIIGGGDSVAAVNKFELADRMTFISTGGGASMELVEGKPLPGVEALR